LRDNRRQRLVNAVIKLLLLLRHASFIRPRRNRQPHLQLPNALLLLLDNLFPPRFLTQLVIILLHLQPLFSRRCRTRRRRRRRLR